jgi:hypothetical protein
LEFKVTATLLIDSLRLFYDFHFRTAQRRYLYLGLTVLAVFLYGVANQVLLGRDPGRVALEGSILAVCGIGFVPFLRAVAEHLVGRRPPSGTFSITIAIANKAKLRSTDRT